MRKLTKRLMLIVMVVALTFCSVLSVWANTNVGNTYQIDNVTVVFEKDSQLSAEQQKMQAFS